MPYKNSDGTINFRIDFDPEIWDMLENFCTKTGRSRKAIVEHALIEHVEKPMRPFPPLLEEIAKRKRMGRSTLEGDPAKLSRRPKRGRKRKEA